MNRSLTKIWLRFRSLFRRGRVEAELDDELRFHIERTIAEKIASGMSGEGAREAALREFGGVEQIREECADARRVNWFEDFAQDVRYGLRILRKSPGFTAVAIITLALGIGVNTLMFSVLDAVLLKPLPYENSSRLAIIWQTDAAHRASGAWFDNYREFQEWARSSKSFEKMAAFTWAHVDSTVRVKEEPRHVLGIPVSRDFFTVLGVSAAHGRTFAPEDERNPCAVVLSDAFWRGELGTADVVGGTLEVNDKPCAVVGIMPKDFSFYPKRAQVWILISADGEFAKDAWHSQVGVMGLLRPGVTRAGAETELASLEARIMSEAPPDFTLKSSPDVLPLQSEFIWLTGRNLRTTLVVLFLAVTFVLLIACVNVATLFLGRAAERESEFGIRAALGSSRMRTVRQLLTESLLLSLCGSCFGVVLAAAGIRYLNAANPVELPPGNTVALNWQVLAFTLLSAVVSATLFGLIPAWKASRYDLNALIKRDTRRSERAGKVFVISEVALSLVLLAGAGLMVQSLLRLSSTPLGFQPAHLLTGNIDLPAKTYATPPQRLNYYATLKTAVLGIPGVQGVAFAPIVPSGSNLLSIQGERGPYDGAVANDVDEADVDPDYFGTVEIPLLHGRAFDSHDASRTLPVAVVNRAFAEKYFNGDAIGRLIKLGRPVGKRPWLTVVGVVGDVKSFTVFKEMGYVTPPCIYRPLAQSDAQGVAIFVRSGLDPSGLVPAVRRGFLRLNGNIAPPDFTTMQDWLAQFTSQPRLRAVLFSSFAFLGLLLCGVGIFGVISQSVAQRSREIGIRMALGAQQGDTLRLIVRQAVGLTAAGIAVGIASALALTRAIAGLLYGVSATDPATFAAVALFLLLVAIAACYIPARRATRVDPTIALRQE
jgi:putative ABC transport system permease protein